MRALAVFIFLLTTTPALANCIAYATAIKTQQRFTAEGRTNEHAQSHVLARCTATGATCIVTDAYCYGKKQPIVSLRPTQGFDDLQWLWWLLLAAIVGLGYLFFFKWARGNQPAPVQEVKEPIPEAPTMPPPREGALAVGLRQVGNYVYVWLQVSEADLIRLRSVMHVAVDEYPRNLALEERGTELYMAGLKEAYYRAGLTEEQVEKHLRKDAQEEKKRLSKPEYITLQQMLQFPFRYEPSIRGETHADYLDRLRTKVLPKIKQMVEFAGKPKDEQFEL